jgi:ABC-type molybdate transport system ATPase subunit
MVQMAPNSSTVSAVVDSLETYAAQNNFYVVHLGITELKKSSGEMKGAEKGAKVKALLSKETADELKLKKGVKVNCEMKKVSPDLWRVSTITVKS